MSRKDLFNKNGKESLQAQIWMIYNNDLQFAEHNTLENILNVKSAAIVRFIMCVMR